MTKRLAKKFNIRGVPRSAGRAFGPCHRRQGGGIQVRRCGPTSSSYAHRVVENARALAASLEQNGLRIVSGGTDNHSMLVDLTGAGDGSVTGKACRAWSRSGVAHLQQERHPVRQPFAVSSPAAFALVPRRAPRAASERPSFAQVGQLIARGHRRTWPKTGAKVMTQAVEEQVREPRSLNYAA